MKRIVAFTAFTIMLLFLGTISWYHRASAHINPTAKLGINIAGPNWLDPTWVNQIINNVRDTGVNWVFLPVIWFNFEYGSGPIYGTCPDLMYPEGYNADRSYFYWTSPSRPGATVKCHRYLGGQVDVLDRLVPNFVGGAGGLKGNGNTVAMGMYWPAKWAGGGSPPTDGTSVVYRSFLPYFSENAVDLAYFLVQRYQPAAFSVWNEPDGWRYLSIEPDPSREFWYSGSCDRPGGGSSDGCLTWSAWEDYYTYLLQPIAAAVRNIPGVPAPLIIGPELATGGADYGRNAADDYWIINVGHWDIHWNSYLLSDGRAAAIDRWSLHAYGDDWHWVPSSPVGNTWNNMLAHGVTKPIWATESNMDFGSACGQTQRELANWYCEVNRTQPHDLTFTFPGGEDNGTSCTLYDSPDQPTSSGLWGSPWNAYYPKWLVGAFHAILEGNYYCS